MFIGAINSTIRNFLASTAAAFDNKVVVVGCSGNFTSESVLSKFAHPKGIHSNDVSFYSCMLGRWLTRQPLEFTITDAEYEWLTPYLADDTRKLAAIMVLLDMLEFEKRNNPHRVRMWKLYEQDFPELVNQTMGRLATADAGLKVSSFYEGDVFAHFERFAADKDAVFCCYAPTYKGGYERLYKKLDKIVQWNEPTYGLLDDDGRDKLLGWMTARRFLWYDDRRVEGLEPVMEQRGSLAKTVYLYSNVVPRPVLFDSLYQLGKKVKLPLAGASLEIAEDSVVKFQQMKPIELTTYKDVFLAKHINYASGQWAFAVMVDNQTVGFLEFKKPDRGISFIGFLYMMADFPVSGTPYKRLSKLILMLAKSKDTRALLERLRQIRTTHLTTTAYTDKPVSMKYRGVFELDKRSQNKEGKKFLTYNAEFNNLTWQETLNEWLTKHSLQN